MEVAPAYDGTGEQTALTAAQLGFEILTSWVSRGLKQRDEYKERKVETSTKVGNKGSKRDEL